MSDIENITSIQDIRQQINAMKAVSFLLNKEQRKQCKELEMNLDRIVRQMSLFSDRFSSLGWCSYDSISLSLVEKANEIYDVEGEEAAEKILIDYYKNDVKDNIYQIRQKSKELSLRHEMIQNAFKEHFEQRYYASVPLFLIIVDGAVNDFTKSKGFFAEGTEVTAWDCLVGCNDSLDKIRTVFNKKRGKTTLEEIRMPYRNGILHGRDLNYGNEYVSCKCVALLFAVAEWMAMKNSEEIRKEKYTKEHESIPLIESLHRNKQLQEDKRKIDAWEKRTVEIGKDIPAYGDSVDYEQYPYIIPVLQFLQSWKNKNYGMLGKVMVKMFSYEPSEKKRAGEARIFFEYKQFESYKLLEVEEKACCMSKVVLNVTWKSNGEAKSGNLILGVVYMSLKPDDKEVALPWKNNGEWVLHPWDVRVLN